MTEIIRISAILAVSENNVIGSDNTLPWRLSNDLKWFKKNTLNKPMIMGRKTFDSLPGMLPARTSVVLTRDTSFNAEGVLVAHSVETALTLAKEDARTRQSNEIMIIGGGEIYRLFDTEIARFYLTRVHTSIPGDTYFYDLPADQWTSHFSEKHPASEKNDHPHTFQILDRIQ